MGYKLTFDTLDFSPGNSSGEGYWFEVLGANFELGAPQPVTATINTMLQDGSMVVKTGDDNRQAGFVVVVRGDDLLTVAAGERALALAVGKRTTLTYTPPDGIAPPTVFDVLTSHMEQPFDDLEELRDCRAYTLALTCLPFARAESAITTTFSPATPTITTLDDASTLTNWSPAPSSAPATLAAVTYLTDTAVKVHNTQTGTATAWPTLRFSGARSGTYLAYDIAVGAGVYPFNAYLAAPEGTRAPVAVEMLANGYRRYYFTQLAGTGPADLILSGVGPGADAWVAGVYASTSLPGTGVLAGSVEGSVRTQGVISVSGGAALGDTMVYADPSMLTSGWQPDNPNTWATAPEGTYAVYRSNATTTTGSVSMTYGSQTISTWRYDTVPANTFFPVGRFALGGSRVGTVGSGFATAMAGLTLRIFRMAPDTSLTYVRGLTNKRLLIDLPSLDYPRGGVWAGDLADNSDAVSVLNSTDAWDFPGLTPPRTAYFVRASGVAAPVTSVTYFPRYHTNSML